MVKLFFSVIPVILLSLVAFAFQQVQQLQHVVGWADLGIVKQISIIAGISLMLVVGFVASKVFRNVWIKKGYEGIDEKLEGKEVALLMSHVFGFISLEIFIFMITFYQELGPPSYAFYICGLSFVGPEVYLAFNMMKKVEKIEKEDAS